MSNESGLGFNAGTHSEVLDWMFYSGDYQSFIQAVEDGYTYKRFKSKASIYAHFAKEFDRFFVQVVYRERSGLDAETCKSELACLSDKFKIDEATERAEMGKRSKSRSI